MRGSLDTGAREFQVPLIPARLIGPATLFIQRINRSGIVQCAVTRVATEPMTAALNAP